MRNSRKENREKIKNIKIDNWSIDKGSSRKEIVVMVPAWFNTYYNKQRWYETILNGVMRKNKHSEKVWIPTFSEGIKRDSLNSEAWIQNITMELRSIFNFIILNFEEYDVIFVSHSAGAIPLSLFLSGINSKEKLKISKILMICPTFSFKHKDLAKKFINQNHNRPIIESGKEIQHLHNISESFKTIKKINGVKVTCIIPENDWQCKADDTLDFLSNPKLISIPKSNHVFETWSGFKYSKLKKRMFDYKINRMLKKKISSFINSR